MIAQTVNSSTRTEKELLVKMVLDAWDAQNSRVDRLLEELTDDALKAESAPGKNTGVYLIGHITATSDGLLPLFGFSQRLYPQLEEVFLKNPENAGLGKPSIADLKSFWRGVNAKIKEHFSRMSPDDWFGKHVAISSEDFAKEPHRNKLNVLISRTNHQSYHLGQLINLKGK